MTEKYVKTTRDIVLILKEWINKKDIDVIITTGGTGLTGRDITPEAIEEIADKQIPGFGEVFRTISLKTVGTSAIQSRGLCSFTNGKYVFALPGSSGGVTDAWDGILKHQLDINHKPCNFVELFQDLKKIIIFGIFLSIQNKAFHKCALLHQDQIWLHLFFSLFSIPPRQTISAKIS